MIGRNLSLCVIQVAKLEECLITAQTMVNEVSGSTSVAIADATTNANRASTLLKAVTTPLPADTSDTNIEHDREQTTAGTDKTITAVTAMLDGE